MRRLNCGRRMRLFTFLFAGIFLWTAFLSPLRAQMGDQKITDEQLERLKQRTVLLLLPSSQYAYLDDYKEMIPKAWTLTPIEVIKYSQIESYLSEPEKYAIFGISSLTTSGSAVNTHFWLSLSVPRVVEKRKKTKTESDDLCRIELYPDRETLNENSFSKDYDKLYEGSNMRNFTLPYMMTYMRYVQKNVERQRNKWVYGEWKDHDLLDRLATDTLYVPDSLVYHRSGFSSKEDMNEKDLFADYGGKYRILSTAELTQLIKNRKDKKPLFLFEYVLSSTDKFVSVYDVTTGSMVYRHYTAMTYNLKPKDINAILK